jgi:uncharacterized YigZ family protein
MELILPKAGVYEYEEKRSKFIGYCAPVNNEEAARKAITEIRAAHPKANHNVFAYKADGIERMSDDGEPQGTAGKPVLNVFQKNNVVNYVCVVTRYYGGIQLGAGGLVRAYTKTAKGAMENAAPEELVVYETYNVVCTYSNLDKLKYDFEKIGVEILDINYTENCAISVRVRESETTRFLEAVPSGSPCFTKMRKH